MNLERLKAQLIRHEGKSLKVYEDTAKPPRLTVGVGRNLSDRGISEDECALMLDNDIKMAELYAKGYEWYESLDEVRQAVVIDMQFNLGPTRFAGFKKMIEAIERKDWKEAATQMLDSAWSVQVGNRALRLAEMMRSGEWP